MSKEQARESAQPAPPANPVERWISSLDKLPMRTYEIAMGEPSENLVRMFSHWHDQLACMVTDDPTPQIVEAGIPTISSSEAIDIMHKVVTLKDRISLQLLEKSGITRAIACLKNHANKDVANTACNVCPDALESRTCAAY